MKALVLTEKGPTITDAPTPIPGPAEILVKVRAAALNRADLAMAAGHAHGRAGGLGNVLGIEWSGEVVKIGDEVGEIRVGDAVMGSGAGAFAEYVKTDWGRVLPVPAKEMPYEQASALPVALQTMHDAIVVNGALSPGETVLIQGASSCVGLMGLQIAKLMGAGLVIGTSSTPERRARLSEFGADLALDWKDPSWVDDILQTTGGRGADLIIDQIAGPVANQNMRAAAIKGRIINVGRLGGMNADFNFDLHALRRLHYIGVTFRTRSNDEIRELVRKARADLWESLQDGRLGLPIDRTFPFESAAEALGFMASNAHFGKIVLRF